MSAIEGFEEGIRAAAAPARSAGHRVPDPRPAPEAVETEGRIVAPARPLQRVYPRTGDKGLAFQGAANDYGWRPQASVEMKSYAETVAQRSVSGAVATIDPNVCTVWILAVDGLVTLEILPIREEPLADPLAPSPSRVLSLVLILTRAAGSSIVWPAGTLWPEHVREPDPDDPSYSLLDPPASARIDQFVLELVPGLGWLGNVAGVGYQEIV